MNARHTKARLAFSSLVMLLLIGCALVGAPSPKTFNEQLAVGYATVTSIRESATTLLVADKLTVDDAKNIQEQADNARLALDLAASLRGSNPGAAQDRLDATLVTLQAVQKYLDGRRQ